MRLNKYVALATGMSRRAADTAIVEQRIRINDELARPGQEVTETDTVTVDGHRVTTDRALQTILLNKPVGYVCSRDGQGSQTIYDLIPKYLHHLKPVGRLDKDSSGLLLMTNDGTLAHQMTHPSFEKTKVYKIALSKPLSNDDFKTITTTGVTLDDQPSILGLEHINAGDYHNWKVTMHEGRNRQIRRTFEALNYNVVKLHRTRFGDHRLESLQPGHFQKIP